MTGMRVVLIGILISAFSLSTMAQEKFLSRLQGRKSAKEGVVVVHQSQEITDLVNGTRSSAASAKAAATKPTTTTKTPATSESSSSESSASTTYTATKRIARNRVKSNGYRIQVYAGGNSRSSRQEAQRMAARVKGSFPELPVYTHFYNPRWVCRVGDFKTYEEASSVLRQMKAIGGFKEALIIKGQILISL